MKNKYEIKNGVVTIHIHRLNGQKFEALVSEEDFVAVNISDISWCIDDKTKRRGGYYAYCRAPRNYPQQNLSMHRLLAHAKEGELVDRINGNTLDNRRENLRIADHTQNNHNRTRRNRNNTSGAKGVARHTQSKKWRAYIMLDYKQKHLGLFDTVEEAAEAVRKAKVKFMPYSPEAQEAACA